MRAAYLRKSAFGLLLIAAALAARPARASRDALIVLEGAQIFAEATDTSDKLLRMHQGDIVRISDHDLNGWYRIALPETVDARHFGWIQALNLSTQAFKTELSDSGIQMAITRHVPQARHHWGLLGFYDGLYIQPTDNQRTKGLVQDSFFAVSYGLELGYRLETDWTLIFHTGLHQYASFFATGIAGAVAIEYFYLHALPWKLGMSFGAGASFHTTIGGTVSAQSVRSDPFTAPMAMGKLDARYYVLSQVAFELEAGYRVLYKSHVALSTTDVDVQLSAPFVGAGLQLEF